MFIQPNFTFNKIYSRDIGVSIVTFDSGIFNDVGVEYSTDVSIEHNLIDYNPYYTENFSETSEIELNLLVYNPVTMKAIDISNANLEELYDWLITDDFSSFVSDDNVDLTYYFKVIKIQKVLSFNREGYLRVTFKPFSKYAYKRRVYNAIVNGEEEIDIFNLSRQLYHPMIEITNKGDNSTVNMINDMKIIDINRNETVVIDNLTKLVQSKDGVNKFSHCQDRKWLELEPRKNNKIILKGNMEIKIICEFPILL